MLSDARHDQIRKRRLYERAGVGEYWIVDANPDRVEVYRLPPGATAYLPPTLVERGMTLSTDLLPGLAVDLARLFS